MYFCLITVKAVRIELVSDLTTEAFFASLRRFIARRGKPTLIWSDHGTNFAGANNELKEIGEFFDHQKSQEVLSKFCSSQNIEWKFIPERTPHFGGLWEAAVKSTKYYLKHIVSTVKLTFEEMSTVLTQIKACLNSRPLVPLICDEDGFEALTPGHFLIGRSLDFLTDHFLSCCSIPLLHRWHLCQNLVRNFWQRWSTEYLSTLNRFAKWYRLSRNLSVGDIVVLQGENVAPTRWPLAKVLQIHPGKDGIVQVVTVKMSCGIYKRPVPKVALLLPREH